MYREGGVYLDIKSAMKYPLDNMIRPDDEYILVHWFSREQCTVLKNKYGEYQQWHIICRPNHPYLKSVIEKVLQNILSYHASSDGVAKKGVLKLTGPIAYTLAILPIVNMHRHRLFYAHENIGLVYNNIGKNHENLFDSPHYSKIKEPIVMTSNSA
jgi:mannosyltransferase OCH1-like enzyme